MRPLRAVTLALVLSVGLGAGLTGCSTGENTAASDVQSEAASADGADGPVVNRSPDFPLPEIVGDFDEIPEMVPVDDAPPKDITFKLLHPGDGATVGVNDIVTVNYAGFLWDGKPFDSSFGRGEPSTFGLSAVIEGWRYGLAGSQVGDRVLLVVPPQYGYGAAGTGDIPGDSTLVFVVDVLDTIGSDVTELKEATLTENPLPEGLLVEGELGEAPRIIFEDGSPSPKEESVIVVAEGKGPVITAEDTVVYHYAGAFWNTTDTATSTWQSGPEVIEAKNSKFLGEHAGSRLAMIFPGQGEEQPTMVMVVDILKVSAP